MQVKERHRGNTAGDWDAYYISPTGKRFRSRREVAMALGLPDSNPRKLPMQVALRKQGDRPLEDAPARKMDGPHMSRRAALKQGTAAVGGMFEGAFNSLLHEIKKQKKCRCRSSGLLNHAVRLHCTKGRHQQSCCPMFVLFVIVIALCVDC